MTVVKSRITRRACAGIAGAREVMTRPDFLNDLDHLNVIQVDTHYKWADHRPSQFLENNGNAFG